MIAETLPISKWLVFPIAAIIALAAGLIAGKLWEFVMANLGHSGYVAETGDQRAMRVYMEKAKQGMRD